MRLPMMMTTYKVNLVFVYIVSIWLISLCSTLNAKERIWDCRRYPYAPGCRGVTAKRSNGYVISPPQAETRDIRSNDDKSAIKPEDSEFLSEYGVQIKKIVLPGFLVIGDIERLPEVRAFREPTMRIFKGNRLLQMLTDDLVNDQNSEKD
ncbi:uncharacterized protein LOC141850264 [Brevipalpus obovatus]|uniref:uncharacterized protein LOC141850264 n=1 Tax=Brevipalpus obovatus TaxID=246614 RepID=UPI003D9DCB7B